jgi:tol-pal system protein YbgF
MDLMSMRESVGVLSPARRPNKIEKASTRPSPEQPKRPSPTASSQDPKELYNGAYKAYSDRDYPTAISRFQEFINAFPSSDLADNAFYWIGESYYAKEDFERAISSFLKLVDRYPNGNKVPDALFKIGLSYNRLRDSQRAREFFTRVMDNYPFSEAAKKAHASLDALD